MSTQTPGCATRVSSSSPHPAASHHGTYVFCLPEGTAQSTFTSCLDLPKEGVREPLRQGKSLLVCSSCLFPLHSTPKGTTAVKPQVLDAPRPWLGAEELSRIARHQCHLRPRAWDSFAKTDCSGWRRNRTQPYAHFLPSAPTQGADLG